MQAAADWLDVQASRADRFLLVVDEFDPHEPFDVPEPWANRNDPDWDGPNIIWPPHAVDAIASAAIDARSARHVRANYGAKLTFIDHWLGRILDRFDEQDLWSDTALIVCTDHGHYLGERDIFGRPGAPVPFWAIRPEVEPAHELYDVSVDPDETENRSDIAAEATMIELLRNALGSIHVPPDQLLRLGPV